MNNAIRLRATFAIGAHHEEVDLSRRAIARAHTIIDPIPSLTGFHEDVARNIDGLPGAAFGDRGAGVQWNGSTSSRSR